MLRNLLKNCTKCMCDFLFCWICYLFAFAAKTMHCSGHILAETWICNTWKLHFSGKFGMITPSSFIPTIIIIICYYSIRPIYMPGPAFPMTTLWAISNIDSLRPTSQDKTLKGRLQTVGGLWFWTSAANKLLSLSTYLLWKQLNIKFLG